MNSATSRPLRIVIANSGRRWIGEVGHCVLLIEALRRRGNEVWLACRAGYPLERYAARQGIPTLPLNYESQFHPAHDWADVSALARFLREQSVDVLHVHRGKDHWIGAAAARRARKPIVRTRHVVTPARRHVFNRWLYKNAADAVVSVSRAAEASLAGLVDAHPRRRVILSAVDGEKFHPRRRSDAWRRAHLAPGFSGEPLWIGLIGRFQKVKGQAVFAEAAARVAREIPEAHFFMAGRSGPKHRARYAEFARERGFAGRITVEGQLADLPEAMASFDISVVASLGSEGSSRVTLESMACGVPMVATRVGGIPEIMRAEAAGAASPFGLLVPPGDPEALARAILDLARDPARRAAMGAAGRAAAVEHHDPDRWAAQMESVYREAVAARA